MGGGNIPPLFKMGEVSVPIPPVPTLLWNECLSLNQHIMYFVLSRLMPFINIDKLPFEKIHDRCCKNILGVHNKSSNFAPKCELGRQPVLNSITILALKYFQKTQITSL